MKRPAVEEEGGSEAGLTAAAAEAAAAASFALMLRLSKLTSDESAALAGAAGVACNGTARTVQV